MVQFLISLCLQFLELNYIFNSIKRKIVISSLENSGVAFGAGVYGILMVQALEIFQC
jgi:hypothetical protein